MELFRMMLELVSTFILPLLLVGIPLYGLCRKVKVYEVFISGAKDGFGVAVMIIPYVVAILVAIGMFRASGGMKLLTNALSTPMSWIGMPPELLPMAIVRPLSGSGSTAVMADMKATHGAGDIRTKMAATLYGSAETTFYVLAVYFGAVGIRKTRHAVVVGLAADIAGVFLAVWIVRLLVGA